MAFWLSYLRGLKGNNKIVSSRWLYAAWRMATLYSTTDEFHQSFVTGRHPAATDVLIDPRRGFWRFLLSHFTINDHNQP
jgi:VanZ family protein